MNALRKLFGRSTPAPRATVKPKLEALEDRMVPATIACVPNGGGVYGIFGSDRVLYHYSPSSGSWGSEITNHVAQVAVGADGILDWADTSGNVFQLTPILGTSLVIPFKLTQGQIGALAAGPNGQVYVTYGSNQELYRHDMWGSWHDLHEAGIKDISVSNTGTLFKVYNDGTLHSADGNDDRWSDRYLLGNSWSWPMVCHVAALTGDTYVYTYSVWPSGYWSPAPPQLYQIGGVWMADNVAQVSSDASWDVAYVDTSGNVVYNGQHIGSWFQAS
jgi:hypothetical protein